MDLLLMYKTEVNLLFNVGYIIKFIYKLFCALALTLKHVFLLFL